ncbi:class I tRNA ligase family protein [Streptomyces sp. HU2014]|uniref:methionine--tRNA ligase n=1 Tax=Streptomyces sp. HU2014 TaxID=2939414 RepID=UPI00200FE3B6|nr:class I tRNA ligase family protein [Streptomyces sp. HU2014]UQI47620.1 class I tRNA ligase family protein [Streptomyces sp. HU2014]
MLTRTLVTAAPPTPNGDLHLGHLSGPYSGADIHTRALRLHGTPVRYLTGSDVHQSYVPLKARALGEDPLALADRYADVVAAIFASAAFEADTYVRPQHSRLHQEAVRDFVATLHRTGRIVPRTAEGLHCAACDRYLFEGHVSGGCPRCGADSDGNSCEECAWPNVCTDLVDPVCNTCGATPVTRTYERLVFPLGRYTDRLRALHAGTAMSPQLEELCAGLLAGELPDIPVTHPTDWGLPVPVAGFEEQRVYVWAEMVPGYFAELQEALRAEGADPGGWREEWNASRIVQFFGFDNGYFHTVLFPALMMAYDEGLRLPDAFVTNEFFQLDDAKFSKSRGHAIWADALLAEVPGSVVRFALAHDRPETARTSFTWDRFRRLADEELAGAWQGWLDGLFRRVTAVGGGRVPAPGTPTPSQAAFASAVDALADECLAALTAETFSPQRATRCLGELVRLSTAFAAGQSRLLAARPDDDRARTAVALEARAARTLAACAHPLMPDFARQLWHALGLPGEPTRDAGRADLPGTGTHPVAPGPHTFFTPLPADIDTRVMGG